MSAQMNATESLLALLKAKHRAEYDPGVGELCDIVTIEDSAVFKKSPEEVASIMEAFRQHQDEVKALDHNTVQALENI